jgi:hypothetical protein
VSSSRSSERTLPVELPTLSSHVQRRDSCLLQCYDEEEEDDDDDGTRRETRKRNDDDMTQPGLQQQQPLDSSHSFCYTSGFMEDQWVTQTTDGQYIGATRLVVLLLCHHHRDKSRW